jgi:hypothetical protein
MPRIVHFELPADDVERPKLHINIEVPVT